jgi:hypothetical protein
VRWAALHSPWSLGSSLPLHITPRRRAVVQSSKDGGLGKSKKYGKPKPVTSIFDVRPAEKDRTSRITDKPLTLALLRIDELHLWRARLPRRQTRSG